MATRIQIVFDCADPARQAEFWRQALGYRYPDPPEGFPSWEAWARQTLPEDQWNAASALVDPDGIGPRLYFQRVPEPKVAKNRVHLDLNVSTPDANLEERKTQVNAEVARLKDLGASDHRGAMEERGEYWVRMNDPEGNEFCVQ